jgi:hypothetical protein
MRRFVYYFKREWKRERLGYVIGMSVAQILKKHIAMMVY